MYKWIMSALVGVASLFIIVLLITTMPEKQVSSNQPTDFIVPVHAVDAEASMQIYQSNCISCHAAELKGGAGPSLEHIGSAMTKEQIYKLVSDGKGRMPSFKNRLTEDEVITISTWLASLQ